RFGGGMVTADTLHERVRLSETGLVAAVIVLQRGTQQLVGGPQLSGQGLSLDEQVLLPRVAQDARALFEEMSVQLRGDDALVREELTRVVRRAFRLYSSKRPLVVPMVVRV
ncbi:ribonuclease J, partial [Myxococcus fulvus]